jgi:nucleotide-binding universal stress UspA family protein
MLLAYVSGPAPRASLDLVRRRPGGRPLPLERERDLREAEAEAGGRAISEAEAAAREHGARPESIKLAGEPGRAICELADQRGADLVVVRATGWDRPPIGGPALGPAARFIADHCRAPVLLLRN